MLSIDEGDCYGDSLGRLVVEGVKKPIHDGATDLIYLDPPFSCARNYKLLSKQHRAKIRLTRS
jgi:hypothetical protein